MKKKCMVFCCTLFLVLGMMSFPVKASAASVMDAEETPAVQPSGSDDTFCWNPDGEDKEKKYFASLEYINLSAGVKADGWYTFSGDEGEVVLLHDAGGYGAYTYDAMFYTGLHEVWSNSDSQTAFGNLYQGGGFALGSTNWELASTNMKVFDDYDAMMTYLETGVIDQAHLKHDGFNNFQYDDRISLDDFRVDYHDSNIADDCYIEFFYVPTQYMLENGGTCIVYWEYDFESSWALEIIPDNHHCSGSFMLDLSKNRCTKYLDYLCDDVNLGMMIGKELGIVDGDNLSIGTDISDNISIDIDGTSIRHITKSQFSFEFVPSVSGVNGNNFQATVDCLSGSSKTSYSSPTYDQSADKYTEDYQTVPESVVIKKEHYYTLVSQDNYGNNTYNYYYINNYGISTEISNDGSETPVTPGTKDINHHVDGSLNINIIDSGGGSGSRSDSIPPLIIQDDDYSNGQFVDDVSNLWGLVDDMETATEDDGPLRFLYDALGFLPPDLIGMMGYGVSSVVIVGILRALFRR